MDIEAELARLSREAREKLDADKTAEPPAEAKGSDDALDRKLAELSQPSRAEEVEEPAERTRANLRRPGSLPLGAKVVVGLAAIIALLVIIKVVVAPLLYAAVLIGLLVAVVFVVLKVMGIDLGGDDEGEAKP